MFLCLHGEPTWSYLYRKMIPVLAGPGRRVVAPDLVGFGKSDKLVHQRDYSFGLHRGLLVDFIQRLDLRNITLVCHDWGGILGLTLPVEMPERFSRLIVMNTVLGTADARFNPAFRAWRWWAGRSDDLAVGRVMQLNSRGLSDAERAAYDAPFPTREYKAGAAVFPSLVPLRRRDGGADLVHRARTWWRTSWRGDSFMAIGAADPALGLRTMLPLYRSIRNCPPPMLVNAGHYLPEQGAAVARRALAHFGSNPRPTSNRVTPGQGDGSRGSRLFGAR